MKQLELYIIKILQFLYALYKWLRKPTTTTTRKKQNNKKMNKRTIKCKV